jgi:hypothetical protein
MKKIILENIEKDNYSSFIFEHQESNPVKHLKSVSEKVPNTDGIYFVFAKKNNDTKEHLLFNILNSEYEIYYFGIAGGTTQKGKNSKQKLIGRINNVVGTPSVKRAIYWNNEMVKHNLSEFIVFYSLNNQPKEIEDCIYNFLNKNNLSYPKLNKPRGRKKSDVSS